MTRGGAGSMKPTRIQLYSMVPLMRAAELRTLKGRPAIIGAYNVNFYAQAEGILKGLSRVEAPGIIQASKGANKFQGGPDKIAYMLLEATKNLKYDGPIALHLDHGNEEAALDCLAKGFSSVMIDCSNPDKFTVFQNLETSKKITDEAHKKGKSTEVEYGTLAGVEEDVEHAEGSYADPRVVPAFFIWTGTDAMAPTYGTSHGPFKGDTDKVNLDIAAACYHELYRHRLNLDHFLVSHGSSTVPKEFVDMINKYGGNLPGTSGMSEGLLRQVARWYNKLNIDTDLRLNLTAKLRKLFTERPEIAKASELVGYMYGIMTGTIPAIDVKTEKTIPKEGVTDPRNWLQEINKNAPEVLRKDYRETGDEAFIEVMTLASDSIADHVAHLSGDVFGGKGLAAEVDRKMRQRKMASEYKKR